MGAIVLFDGVCNFCQNSVQFIIKNDTKSYFKFASLQSNIGKEILIKHGLNEHDLSSLVLLENNKIYTRTNGALKIAKQLKGIYPIFYYLFYPFPSFTRDWTYKIIANNRYKWFGKQEECMLPSPEIRARFLD